MTAYCSGPRALAVLALLSACKPSPDDSTSGTSGGDGTTGSATGTTAEPTTAPTTGDTATTTPSTTGTTGTTGTATDITGTSDDTGEDVLCEGTGQSTLTGASIVFPPQKCVFTLAEAAGGVTFTYSVEIAGVIDEVTPLPNDGGNCQTPGSSGLIVSSAIGGGDQSYCLCDQGLCPGPDDPPVSLAVGSFPDGLEWTGVNWSGPSDTNNPFGPPFPPGEYTLEVRATGTWTADAVDFEVLGRFPISLVP